MRRNHRPRGLLPPSRDLPAYNNTPAPNSIEKRPIIFRSKTTLVTMYAARLAPA